MSTSLFEHDRLRTPREDRTALVQPPFDHVTDLVGENLRIRDQVHCDLQGRPLGEISRLARSELLAAARRWTGAYRNVPSELPDPRGLIYLAGHQPQMFHPGVWFKNVALGELARQHGAAAINLIIDNDILSDATLRVPGRPFPTRMSSRSRLIGPTQKSPTRSGGLETASCLARLIGAWLGRLPRW